MPKYDVQVKNPTFNSQTSDWTFQKAFTDQGKELAEKLTGLSHGTLDALSYQAYAMEKDGRIREAKDYIIEDMVTAARDNRLFMMDSHNALRQIGLENINGEINITVSDPIKDAPPKSPSIWTYIKSWFSNEEAKAEIQAYKAQGADVVGMSTVPEAVFARSCSMRIGGVSLVSNLAAGISRQPLCHDEVVAAGEAAKPKMKALIGDFIDRL
jgi:hypothetical protein